MRRIFRRYPKRFRKETVIPILKDMRDPAIRSARQTLTIGTADLEVGEAVAGAAEFTGRRSPPGVHHR